MTHHLFNYYEAFTQAIGEAAMTMRLTALEEKRWTLESAGAGDLRLQQGYEGGGSIAEGVTVAEGWVFYHQSHPGQTNAENFTPDSVFVAPPAKEFCLVCHPAHEWLTVFIPTPLLFPSEDALEFASSAKPQLLKPPPQFTRQFVWLSQRFVEAVESQPELLNSPVAIQAFQNELLEAATTLFAKNQNPVNRHFDRWRNQIKLAEELTLVEPELSRSIATLAKESGVAERTLRTAFNRCYGLSPLEYLRVQRLHQAQQRLLASCPDQTTVTEVAFDLGFWDLGRFASAYRQLFGELPSATLRK